MNFKIESSNNKPEDQSLSFYGSDGVSGTDDNKAGLKESDLNSAQGFEELKATDALKSADGSSSDRGTDYIRFNVDEEGTIKIVDGKMYDKEILLSSLKECLKKVGKLDKKTRHELFQKVCAAFGLPIELVSHLDDETDPQKGISVILNEKIPESASILSQGGVSSREFTANEDEEPYSNSALTNSDYEYDDDDGDDD